MKFYTCLLTICFLFLSCQSVLKTDPALNKSATADANQAKSRYDLIKEEKRKQSEADMPFRGLDLSKNIDVIAFSSTADQSLPQPLWSTISKENPDLFLFSGAPLAFSKPEEKNIVEQYRKLNHIAEYRDVREKIPLMSIWDTDTASLDKESLKTEFIKYWTYLQTTLSKNQKSFYYSKIFGTKKHTLQIIMLDTRTDRSELKKNTDDQIPLAATAFKLSSMDTTAASTDITKPVVETQALTVKEAKPYLADDNKKNHFLSEEQWIWLEKELRKPTGLKILVSSLQVIANDHQFEKWGLFPHERDRLINLLKTTHARNLIIFSGNRQLGAIAQTEIKGLGKIYDVTAGPITAPSPSLIGNSLKDSAYLKDAYSDVNYGLVKINWSAHKALMQIKGLDQSIISSVEAKF